MPDITVPAVFHNQVGKIRWFHFRFFVGKCGPDTLAVLPVDNWWKRSCSTSYLMLACMSDRT